MSRHTWSAISSDESTCTYLNYGHFSSINNNEVTQETNDYEKRYLHMWWSMTKTLSSFHLEMKKNENIIGEICHSKSIQWKFDPFDNQWTWQIQCNHRHRIWFEKKSLISIKTFSSKDNRFYRISICISIVRKKI